jgi:RHS repeat-associated protein
VTKPGASEEDLGLRYAAHWYQSRADFDDAGRLARQTTGADVPEVMAAGQSEVTFGYGTRGLLRYMGSSYRPLLANATYAADSQPVLLTYGDAASTKASFTYDGRRRMATYNLTRTALPTFAPNSHYTAPTSATTQTDLQKLTVTLDDVGNPTSIVDNASTSQWGTSLRPVNRAMLYNDAYQVTRVGYTYLGGTGTQTSPMAAEEAQNSKRHVPIRTNTRRVGWQTQTYDAFGDLVASDDDGAQRYDRSLGTVTSVAGKPHQLATASGVVAKWDDTGNLVDLRVTRAGTCPWGGASSCAQRFVYEWDEVGRLARARRWDYAGNTIPASEPVYPNIPTSTPTVDLAFAYSGGQRVLKSATLQGATTTHSVEVLGSLRLEGTTFDVGTDDYVRDRFTERVFLGGIGRVVYDANGTLPSPSASNQHVYLQMGDHLGSTAVTIDGETGEVVERTTFQAMGGVEGDYRPARWGAFREEYKFTGKEEDTEIGLVYFGARYYHPKLGRFASADPLTIHAAASDLNPYAYVRGQVMRAVDPLGLIECGTHDNGGSTVKTTGCPEKAETPPDRGRAAAAADRASAAAGSAAAAADKAAAIGRTLLDQLPGQRDTNKIIRDAIKDKDRTATPRGYGIGLARGLVRGVVDNTLVLQVAGADKKIIGALPATDPHDVAAAVGDEQGKNVLTAAVAALTAGGGAAKELAARLGRLSINPAELQSGKLVAFEQPGLVGFAQLRGNRLIFGILSINAPTQGLLMLARFRAEAFALGRALGVAEVELVGAEFYNAELRQLLLRHGFTPGVMAAPEAVGGGTMNIVRKVFRL